MISKSPKNNNKNTLKKEENAKAVNDAIGKVRDKLVICLPLC